MNTRRPAVLKVGISKTGKSVRLSRKPAWRTSHRRAHFILEVIERGRTLMTWATTDLAEAEEQYQALLDDRLIPRSRRTRRAA